MKVVMVGPFGLSPKQTMARRALPMARALAERGHHVAVVLPPWSNPSDSGRCYDDGGVRVENLVLPPRIPFIFELLLCTALIRRALAIQPEVIHCFKPKAYAGVCAWVVWHLRGLGLTRARLVVDSDDWEGAGGWNEVERYSWLLKRFFAWQEQWGLIHADAITVASRTLESLVWGLGVSPSKVFYVPNGSSDVTIEHRVEPREPNLLLYTRFFEFKIERVARLFAAIGAQHPTLRFTVAGAGLFGEEQIFMEWLNRLGLGGRVQMLGWVAASDLPGVFAQATLAYYPFDDTLLNRTKCAIKLVDLLSAGVPVVAEAVGQNREYIVHGESGLLVTSEDEACSMAAVNELLNDPTLRERISAGARRRMSDHFLWRRLVAKLEQAYDP